MPKMLGECDCDRECYEKGYDSCPGPDPTPPAHKPNCPYACCVRPVTKKDAVEAHHGQVFYHRYARNADFTALRVRVTGRCKTWKTRESEFRLPVKYGLYQSDAITQDNMCDWFKVDPTQKS